MAASQDPTMPVGGGGGAPTVQEPLMRGYPDDDEFDGGDDAEDALWCWCWYVQCAPVCVCVWMVTEAERRSCV